MKKKYLTLLVTAAVAFTCLAGCGNSKANETALEGSVKDTNAIEDLADGTYQVDFDTDSSMFHVNEACEGHGTLSVKEGAMTVHISLVSKKILNLYPGLAEDAEKEGAELLKPTTDEVTYSDGFTEEVFGFDVPVPYLNEEFDLALVGEKGTWYDHKVSVSNPVPCEQSEENTSALALSDGTYTVSVKLEGGSGKASIDSPCELKVKDGEAIARITWSSPYYDYMIVDGKEYQPVNEDGNSVFEIPVTCFDSPMEIQADTVAMSTPHLIDYKLTFEKN